ncbi:MAG: hypothetical protein JWM34_361 [Ilumatobacteraceae bacterium]|nr:hypothetical protein [Ilumatobacteraceae bacterium]
MPGMGGGYCGYDPDLVALLAGAIDAALDELDSFRCSDIEAQPAMQAVARATSLLRGTWQPFVRSVIGCRAMTGYVPAAIDPGDIANSWLAAFVADRHWQILTDPLADPRASVALTADQVRAVGAWLSAADGHPPLSAPQIVWLGNALATTSQHADLTAAFLPSLTTRGWTALADQLGGDRRQMVNEALLYDGTITTDESDQWAPIDRVFVGLTAVLATDRLVHPDADATVLLEDMTPYAGALLVRGLGLDADDLARVTRSLVEREQFQMDHPDDPADVDVKGPLAADLLFSTILATAGAPTAYVTLVLDDPGLVFDATDDPQLADAVALTATDPAHLSAAAVATTVPTLVRWILAATQQHASVVHHDQLGVLLADLIAPYVVPTLGDDPDGFGLSDAERLAVQQLIIDDPAALDRLLAVRSQAIGTSDDLVHGDAMSRIRALHDLATLLAVIDTMQRSAGIAVAEQNNADWQMFWTMVGWATNLIQLSGPAGAIPGIAVQALQVGLETAGVGPESVGDARARTLSSYSAMTTVAAAIVVCSSFDEMVAAGRIPAGTPLPPIPDLAEPHVATRYEDAFMRWLEDGKFDDDVVWELHGIKQEIASAHEAVADDNTGLVGDS